MNGILGLGLSGVAIVDGVMLLGEKATSVQLETRAWLIPFPLKKRL